jgi:glycosyltransferase involved in cell wall biosynthesis
MICKNEADRLNASLGSVAGWADEIVVLDSGSTDGTAELARQFTDKVWVTDWPGYGAQRNRALDRCTGEWVLSLDADEVLTEALKAQIDQALSGPDLHATVIKFPWRTHLFGRPILRGRYSSPQAKLFKREGTRYRDHLVHDPRQRHEQEHGAEGDSHGHVAAVR